MSLVSKAIHTAGKRYSVDGRRIGRGQTSGSLVNLRTVDMHLGEIKKLQHELNLQATFFTEASDFRKSMLKLVESRLFSGIIMTVILLNTLMLVLSTWRNIENSLGYYFTVLDGIFMAVYIVECVLKIYVWRVRYFFQGWDILDLVIVFTSLFEMVAPLTVGSGFSGGGASIFRVLRVLRALRSLRVLRTIRFLENIQVILITCLHSFQSLGAIMMLMGTFLVIFAVIGRGLFGSEDSKNFGDFGTSSFTLIQLLTLDDWFEIFTGITDKLGYFDVRMFFYLLLYIIIEYFVFLNLFVAVLVDNFQLTLREKMIRKGEEKERLEREKRQLKQEMADNDESDLDSDSEDHLEQLKKKLFSKDEDTGSEDEHVDVTRELKSYMELTTTLEHELLEWYYRILPAIEKDYLVLHNYIACHHRIVDMVVDNTSEVLDRR